MTDHKDAPQDLLVLSNLGQKDRIQILLSEYSTLRAEIVSRTGYGFTLTTIGTIILTWAAKEPWVSSPWYFWLAAAILGFVLSVGVFVNVRDITRAAHRVKDLEHEINSRAGEYLLIWETLSGVATRMGVMKSFFCRVKTAPLSDLPALDASYLEGDAIRRDRNSPDGSKP